MPTGPDPRPPLNAPRRLSLGDAIVVIALLAFIVGWVVFTTWDLDAVRDEDGSKLDFWTGLIVGAVVIGPPMWASRLVAHVIKGDASGE